MSTERSFLSRPGRSNARAAELATASLAMRRLLRGILDTAGRIFSRAHSIVCDARRGAELRASTACRGRQWFAAWFGLGVCQLAAAASGDAGNVDLNRLRAAEREPQNWFTGGRDAGGTYYSPLAQIDADSVKRLGFAWSYGLTTNRAQEATPIVVDGVMYTSGTWGYVYALDAASGRELWRFVPKLDPVYARNPCCDLVNRGVSVWQGRVYVASVDGHLHALSAATGEQLWEADTISDHKLPYSSTGAPQIAGDVVVIGNGGADMGHFGVRGYLSAYDLVSGAFRWRFYTVPPERGQPPENSDVAAAAKTWDQHRPPKFNGGGTPWDGLAYDPDLDLVFAGTGNPAPYDLRELGASTGDSLYTDSIVAVHASSGKLAWYYQETPHDRWDFDATQKMVMTTLTLNGKPRKVLMQASKNGFFYVLDRKSGELLSAEPFTYVNWASRIDRQTGRPIVTPQADWYSGPKAVYPSAAGAHTWSPMSYDPQTSLVYIPVIDVANVWVDLVHNGSAIHYVDSSFTAGAVTVDDDYDASQLSHSHGPMPDVEDLHAARHTTLAREILRAWNPMTGKAAWEVVTSSGLRGFDGGIMSTAGNLVFQGRGSGELFVYRADTGATLKVIDTGSHILAAPMTYSVHGEQFVAVQVGYGGAAIMGATTPPLSAARKYQNTNRIIAFKLGGGDVPKPAVKEPTAFPEPPARVGDPSSIAAGAIRFEQECSRCHVFGPSSTPDLRRLDAGQHAAFDDIVLHGLLGPLGMERFDDVLTPQDVHAIHAYIISESWKAYQVQQTALQTSSK
jgi:quinohemoprotein ethanol dehydrogenase